MGRSLMKNAYNLGVLPQLKEALEDLGFKAADIFEIEPDAALGNGGLGRLAACYLDSMTTLEIPATGYSICYELGIFKQKIVEGQQVELPDNWKDLGAAWLLPKPEEAQAVHFGGTLREFWDDGHLHIVNEDATTVHGRALRHGDRRLRHGARQYSCGCGTPGPPSRWICPCSPGASTSRPPRKRPWLRPLPRCSTRRITTMRASPCGSSSSISSFPPPFSPLPPSTWTCTAL